MHISDLNNLDTRAAQAEFQRCCGSTRWAQQMTARRPFPDFAAFCDAAEEIWQRLSPEDWREAFSHHPKIGDVNSLAAKFGSTKQWVAGEQSGVQGAGMEILHALAEGNSAYERKFGYIFIVCATGKSAAEMLELMQQRLPNEADIEIKTAAAEQAKITRLRLEKLLSGS